MWVFPTNVEVIFTLASAIARSHAAWDVVPFFYPIAFKLLFYHHIHPGFRRGLAGQFAEDMTHHLAYVIDIHRPIFEATFSANERTRFLTAGWNPYHV